jgi:Mg-chelatase subunit ChlD
MATITLKMELPQGGAPAEVELGDHWNVREALDELVYLGMITGTGGSYEICTAQGRILSADETLAGARITSGTMVKVRHKGAALPTAAEEAPKPERGQANHQASQEMDLDDLEESKSFHQLGILLLDGSGSMRSKEGTKTLASLVDEAVREFLADFKKSSIANNFSIAVVTFDDDAGVLMGITDLGQIDTSRSFNPIDKHGGGTDIGNALSTAERIALDHLNKHDDDGLPRGVTMIVMSDGMCQHADKTLEVSKHILGNKDIPIATTLFAANTQQNDQEGIAATSLLKKMVGNGGLYKTTYHKDELRKFFTSSMSIKKRVHTS